MPNEPPPPYPGSPTAPLLEEKSGAPPTPGRAPRSGWSGLLKAGAGLCSRCPLNFLSLPFSVQAVPLQL